MALLLQQPAVLPTATYGEDKTKAMVTKETCKKSHQAASQDSQGKEAVVLHSWQNSRPCVSKHDCDWPKVTPCSAMHPDSYRNKKTAVPSAHMFIGERTQGNCWLTRWSPEICGTALHKMAATGNHRWLKAEQASLSVLPTILRRKATTLTTEQW